MNVMGGRAARRRKTLKRIGLALAALAALPFVLTLLYAFVPPPGSTLMLWRLLGGTVPHYDWVTLEEISPNLVRAVVSSEDARFCEHSGVDWVSVSHVMQSDGSPRGASTIQMQAAKNLFLWPDRSYVRKGLEVPLAYWIDLVWSKRRTIEIYLNIVEWGPGIYGAEAAARHHFGKSASRLTAREAALMAATLPNPLERQAGKPGRTTNRIAGIVQRRMRGIGPYIACIGLK